MEKYDEIKKLSIAELKERHDKSVKIIEAGSKFYREEILRREAEKMNAEMLSMTKQMKYMTIAIMIMTFINVVAVIIQIYQSVK